MVAKLDKINYTQYHTIERDEIKTVVPWEPITPARQALGLATHHITCCASLTSGIGQLDFIVYLAPSMVDRLSGKKRKTDIRNR